MNTRQTSALLVLALCGYPLISDAEPITLKGLAPGMTKAQLEAKYPRFTSTCSPSKANPKTEICRSTSVDDAFGLKTFAGAENATYTALLRNDVVNTIIVEIDSKDFDGAVEAITEKFGTPQHWEPSFSEDRMGASIDQLQVRWMRDDGSMLAGTKRESKTDKASFVLMNLERDIKENADRKKKAAKEAAKDM